MKIIKTLLKLLFLLPHTITISQNFWVETSGPEGGLVQCLAIDKNNIIYSGFNGGWFGPSHNGKCLYKSGNSGLNWESLNIFSNKDIESIVVNDSGVIYLWEGGVGVQRSVNNGYSWELVSHGIDGFYDGILAVGSNDLLILGHYNGVYISTNNGSTWDLSSLHSWSNFLFVDNNDNIYAGIKTGGLNKSTDSGLTWYSIAAGISGEVSGIIQVNDKLFLSTNAGIFISRDNGNNWNFIHNSPENITSIAKGKNNEIFAGTSDKGFFYSSDFGRTWCQNNKNLINLYITSLLVNSTGDIFIGTYGDGLFKNSAQLDYWQIINSGITSNHITSFLKYKKLLFAGSQQGILYKTSDNGNSWIRKDSTYTTMPITCICNSKKSLFFSAWYFPFELLKNNGQWEFINYGKKVDVNESVSGKVFKSTDEGNSWKQTANLNVNSFATFYDSATNYEYILTATGNTGIYLSTDDGENWYPSNNGILNEYIEDIETDGDGNFFASSTNKIFRSSDFGKTWETIYTGSSTVYHITIDIAPNNFIYAGLDWGELILSTDRGNSWIDRSPNTSVNRINSITTDVLNIVYFGNWWGQIFQSFDYGVTWLNINSGMIGGPILNLFCDNNGNIYTGPYGGNVYKCANSTFSPPPPNLFSPSHLATNQNLNLELVWYSAYSANSYKLQVSLNNNFDSSSIILNHTLTDTNFSIGPLNQNTYYYWRVSALNQYGNSLWSGARRFKTKIITSVEDFGTFDFSFNLAQNYPNPFNPSTVICYQLAVGSQVTLKVYDVLGNEVSTLINEEKPPGEHQVEFQSTVGGQQLASGIYYYQLIAGSCIETKKMIIIK
jgi:photosystem II stability/assembly factor-like uncharacterized protein